MSNRLSRRRLLPVCAVVLSLVLLGAGLVGAQPHHSGTHTPPNDLIPIDVDLPSTSTGSPTGALAVRIYAPAAAQARYADGAPVLIWVAGGKTPGSLRNDLPAAADLVIITFLFPGGSDPTAGRHSDGFYDVRGVNCIQALRDVILYAAGELTDDQGRTIDEVAPVPVLYDNIGLLGSSNGGNIVVAVAALYGDELTGHLRYIIQWESPVSSQIGRDLGRIWLKPSTLQGDYFNPRYLSYGPLVLDVDYSDLTFDPDGSLYRVFHDGNGDGEYSTVEDPATHLQVPDLNLDGVLTLDEDFPLDTHPSPSGKGMYSRPVTHALANQDTFGGAWPSDIATPIEADAYWDLREAVRLYDGRSPSRALASIPDLKGMILAGVRDHVQSAPDKPHIHQAFDGWNTNGAWAQINPSPAYLIEADPSLAGRTDLLNRVPNTPPAEWEHAASYCVPEDIPAATYQLAAVWQMADRAQGVFTPTPAGGELITYVDSPGIGEIAVRLRVPETPRYPEGATIVINVATFFTPRSGFGASYNQLPDTMIGAIEAAILWPGEDDPITGAISEGTYDYGGPDCLASLRDSIRFISGLVPNVDGRYVDELLGVTPLTDNVGLYAFSHPGIAATNALAYHGLDLPKVKYLVARESPTLPAYSAAVGYWDENGQAVLNPYYDYPDDYSPTALDIDYSTVGWLQNGDYPEGRPFFEVPDGENHILGPYGAEMFGKRYYALELTQAFFDNDAFGDDPWPADVATVTETLAAWPYRTTVHNYPTLATTAPNLKVMLVFAKDDHAQADPAKYHIHQAYDGFRDTVGFWVRMNPDHAYVQQMRTDYPPEAFPDNSANTEPLDWLSIRDWDYPNIPDVQLYVSLAAVAEMADRVQENNWDNDLDEVLVQYPPAQPTIHRVFLPLILKG